MFPPLSIQTHQHPLNWAEDVQDPYSKQMLPMLMAWGSCLLFSCTIGGTISFALNHVWHSLSVYRTSSKGSLYIPKEFIISSLPNIPDYPWIRVPVLFWFDYIVLPSEQVIHICVDAWYWKNIRTCWSWW